MRFLLYYLALSKNVVERVKIIKLLHLYVKGMISKDQLRMSLRGLATREEIKKALRSTHSVFTKILTADDMCRAYSNESFDVSTAANIVRCVK